MAAADGQRERSRLRGSIQMFPVRLSLLPPHSLPASCHNAIPLRVSLCPWLAAREKKQPLNVRGSAKSATWSVDHLTITRGREVSRSYKRGREIDLDKIPEVSFILGKGRQGRKGKGREVLGWRRNR